MILDDATRLAAQCREGGKAESVLAFGLITLDAKGDVHIGYLASSSGGLDPREYVAIAAGAKILQKWMLKSAEEMEPQGQAQ
jgi:hypothetical protein